MKLSFFGAAGEVTGSCYLLETDRARLLIDFGFHQGEHEERNRKAPPLNAGKLDAIILTHAHLDHAGLMPLLPGVGYTRKVFTTPATIELVAILLHDSAKLQQADAERAKRYGGYQGAGVRPRNGASNSAAAITPLYGETEVGLFLQLLAPLPYDEKREVAPGITARLVDAGHIIGSASVELTVEEKGSKKTIVFSGDLGPTGAPLVRDPTPLNHADAVILESTYGDRDHRPRSETIEQLQAITAAALGGSGKVLIPAFAVGRTQDMVFELGKLYRAGKFKSPVYVDSPMGLEATRVYIHHCDILDDEAHAILKGGNAPLNFPGLEFVKTVEESKHINDLDGGTVVIAASGMCNGGRIVHHLIHNLGNPATQVAFVGYQAVGTTGRRLVDGQKIVHILGETVAVKAQIHTLGGFSAHAGQSGLFDWAKNFTTRPRLILTHGENPARHALGDRLTRELGFRPEYPNYGDSIEL